MAKSEVPTLTSMMIYGHPLAGDNAYALMEAVSEVRRQSGWTELHKTIPNERKITSGADYWPVYKVILAPYHWTTITQEHMNELYEVAKRFCCTVKFRSRLENGHPMFIAVFEHNTVRAVTSMSNG